MREISGLEKDLSFEDLGQRMRDLISELYPICRSMTGDGVRRTLRIIQNRIPLQVREVPSGTKVFDWTVPKEWNIRQAYIKDAKGNKIIDFNRSNLHVVGYSVPVHKTLSLAELKDHLYTLPDRPDWIPYRTSYFKETWGFCMSHRQMTSLEEGPYEVLIDSGLADGHLTYGEFFLEGESPSEVLISTHVCHPSLCNDNLSGIAVATQLAEILRRVRLRHSFRFLFIPATLGSITWLAMNEQKAKSIKHGLVLANLGDSGKTTFKKSRRGSAEIDRIAVYALRRSGEDHDVMDFTPDGYDERQYCSPGFDLPVGVMMRTPNGRYPEYHTSADDLSFVKTACLADSLAKCLSILTILENNVFYISQNPKCEPQLGRRGIYRSYGERSGDPVTEMALLWIMNLADGNHSVLDIAERSGLPFETIGSAADLLVEHGLLKARPEDEP